jgi:hypothetical protein
MSSNCKHGVLRYLCGECGPAEYERLGHECDRLIHLVETLRGERDEALDELHDAVRERDAAHALLATCARVTHGLDVTDAEREQAMSVLAPLIAERDRLDAEVETLAKDRHTEQCRATAANARAERLAKEKRVALVALLRLVIAIDREGWERGESESEARDHACDVLANNGLDRANNKAAVRAALKGNSNG